jgi:hypothetical protein
MTEITDWQNKTVEEIEEIRKSTTGTYRTSGIETGAFPSGWG